MTSSSLRIVSLGLAAACWLHVAPARADASPVPSCSGDCSVDDCSDRGVECNDYESDYDRCVADAEERGWEQECGDPAVGVTVYCEPSDGCRMSRKSERGFWGALLAFGLGVGVTVHRARRLARAGR